ncbi:MAG: Gfo/Idh/MocA family oxidoreductase [Saccharofermentans sp.]|nr:Gfo/Idh/MocA family oxidoreductase [Saccharofermentans sp.]
MSVKWGVLGTANIARGCTIPGMKLAENCELYAIAGRSEEKVEKYKAEFGFEKGYVGYDRLLEDPEVQAVYIPLPNHLHKEWVIKALKAGKNVLSEKPLALNAEDAREMFAVARENNVILMEAYAYLHSPYVAALKEDIASGIIGDVLFVDSAFYTQYYTDDIRMYKEMGGGAIYDLGCYCSTLILSLVDSEVDTVMAQAEFNEYGADVLASALLKFRNGVRAAFNVGMNLGVESNARKDRLYVHGTKGVIDSLVEFNQAGELSYTITAGGKTTVRTVNAPQNYSLEVAQLGRCIESGEKPFITEEFTVKNAELLDAVLVQIGY